jgi:hypothetical protein
MNPLTLNAVALGIFCMTLSVLLGPYLHLSPLLSTGTIFGMLCALTIDATGFQSRGLTLTLDSIAQRWPPYRKRVVHHEAGHFLVAYLLDLPIESYSLSAWEAMKHRDNAYGGVVLGLPSHEPPTDWVTSNLEKLCAVWVAGGMAEELQYGSVEGDTDDRQQLRQTLKQWGHDPARYERQAQRFARQLLQEHWVSYQTLVPALVARKTVAECCAVIEQSKSRVV